MLDEHFCIQLQGQKRINLGKYKVISDQTERILLWRSNINSNLNAQVRIVSVRQMIFLKYS